MSSFVATLLAQLVAVLPSTPTRSADEFVGSDGVDVAVSGSTPTKLPKSTSDELTSGSGEAATTEAFRTFTSTRIS